MKQLSAIRPSVLILSSLMPALCQISQDHPELCGDRGRFEAVPRDLSATINNLNGTATLRAGPKHSIELSGINTEIHQVCSLASDRLVSFGYNFVGYTVNIVDLRHAVVADSFVAYDPVMSRNQRWIASRHFYAPQSEIRISEEYLLYDLNASASENRHNVTPYTDAAGWAMYPAYPGGAPVDLGDIPEDESHGWQSKSFFWSPDSQSLVFADSVGDEVSLVLVLIKSDKPQAYTYSVPAADVASASGQVAPCLMLKDASISPASNGAPSVFATFDDSGGGCQARQVRLNFDEFQPARLETYKHRKLKKPTPIR